MVHFSLVGINSLLQWRIGYFTNIDACSTKLTSELFLMHSTDCSQWLLYPPFSTTYHRVQQKVSEKWETSQLISVLKNDF